MANGSDGDLTARAAALLTEPGYLNEMAGIFDSLATGDLTRDETSALIGARRCLESFRDAREGRTRSKEHEKLIKDLRKTREALKQKGSGSTSLTDEQLSLPRRAGKGTPKK